MLAHKIEPPVAVVASTARADPALALAADPGAASSAPQVAAEAAEASKHGRDAGTHARERAASRKTYSVASVRKRTPDAELVIVATVATVTSKVARRPLIVELVNDEEISQRRSWSRTVRPHR